MSIQVYPKNAEFAFIWLWNQSVDCGINPLEHTQYFLMELTDEPVSIWVSRLEIQCQVAGEVEFSVSRALLELEMNSDLMARCGSSISPRQ